MNDLQAIQQLGYRYAQIIDRKQFEQLADIMLPNCEFVSDLFHYQNCDEIITGMGLLEQFKGTFHAVQNQLININGTRADGEVYCVASHILTKDGQDYKLDWGIRYLDAYQKEGDIWQFSKRELIIDWTQQLPCNQS